MRRCQISHLCAFQPKIQSSVIKTFVDSIIEGNTVAILSANDSDDEQDRCFLIEISPKIFIFLGNATNSTFNSQIYEYFENQIIPKAIETKNTYFKLYYDTVEWKETLHSCLFESNPQPFQAQRLLYGLSLEKEHLRLNLSPEIEEENQNIRYFNLAADTWEEFEKLPNSAAIISEIEEAWASHDIFKQKGFGTLALDMEKNNEIIGWILGEFRVHDQIGIGIEVEPAYRNQKIATHLGRLFIILARKKEVNLVWDSWGFNTASKKTAECLGFSLLENYTITYGYWDFPSALIEQAYLLRDEHKYKEAGDATKDAIKQSTDPVNFRIYYLAACNYALAEETETALYFLGQAFAHRTEKPQKFIAHLEKDEDMDNIRSTPEYLKLLQRMK